jgi:Fe-S-cluster containining protein
MGPQPTVEGRMVKTTTSLLTERKTGPIAIVWNGTFASVQFNGNCLDMLEFCHGMCCRRRSGYTVELEASERGRYFSEPHPTRPFVEILATKKNGETCVYQDEETGKCTIHEDRPKMCRQWHCSPEGSPDDKEIVRRDAGWMLLPVRKEEADFVSLRRADG